MSRGTRLAGRRDELAVLGTALSRGSTFVLITGEAGVGKSRLISEALRRAASSHCVTAAAGCLPLESKLPLLPFTDALRELNRLQQGELVGAALDRLPPYVRGQLGRLLPRLWNGDFSSDGSLDQALDRQRLFSAFGELVAELAERSRVILVIEDVQWADETTLDLLTYLRATSHARALSLLVTCRTDEAPLPKSVSEWLAHSRAARASEIHLSALTPDQVAQQVAALVHGPVTTGLIEELYARAEGNPFMTEQLLAAARTASADPVLHLPRQLPSGLLDLLSTRIQQVSDDSRGVLAALAVAGRPLTERALCEVTWVDNRGLRNALRELSAASMLVSSVKDCTYDIRHVLLAEAILADLLPGELASLHGGVARALEAMHDPALSAEIAGHWAQAGRPEEELRATVKAAGAARDVFAFGAAAGLWQRAIALCEQHPAHASAAGLDLARLYVEAIDALQGAGGRREAARELAETAYARFADWPDKRVAALVRLRVARYRQLDCPSVARRLIEQALELFDSAPPSADHAQALLAQTMLYDSAGQIANAERAITKGLHIAELSGAVGTSVHFLACRAHLDLQLGQVDKAFDTLRRARVLAEGMSDVDPVLALDVMESDALLKLARSEEAGRVARDGLNRAGRGGRGSTITAAILRSNAAEAMLDLGLTNAAGLMLDPLTQGRPHLDDWVMHVGRADVDTRRGLLQEATERLDAVRRLLLDADAEFEREITQREAEVALWQGSAERCLLVVQRALARCATTDQEPLCGDLVVLGMRAAADVADRARTRDDSRAHEDAIRAADQIAETVSAMGGRPLSQHARLARTPVHRLAWEAESGRLRARSDPTAWTAVAHGWESLHSAHRAAYAWWRCAEALADAGSLSAAADPLRSAATHAREMLPLQNAIERLAQRSRVTLTTPPRRAAPPRDVAPYAGDRLTAREHEVLRLVAAGCTNKQIGARLSVSRKAASALVSDVLRKLHVADREAAVAAATQSGQLDDNHSTWMSPRL